MRALKSFLPLSLFAICALTAPSAFGTIAYRVTVDTSSQIGNYGYLDMEFNPAPGTTQAATATVTGFETDGMLSPGDPNNDAVGGVTGTLPGLVSFQNDESDYFEGLTFGNTIVFFLYFSGPAFDAPNGDGGGTFLLDFLNADQTAQLFTANASAVPVLTVTINPDGTTTATTFASANNGPPVVTLSGPAQVSLPEPATIPLVGIGIAALAAFRLRRKIA